MEITDVMINDWVRVLPISNRTEPHISKVSAINRVNETKVYIEGGYYPKTQGWSVSPDYINGIPLTREILDDNGWKDGTELNSIFEKDITRYRADVPFVVVFLKETPSPYITLGGHYLCDVKYVSDLQHALRLVGNHELADNFNLEL